MKQKLYRHFDANGSLLYVGISSSITARIAAHKNSSHWFDDVVTIKIESYETREQVLEAELLAIQTEFPKFNIMNSLLEHRVTRDWKSVLLGFSGVARKLGINENQFQRMIVNGEFNVPYLPGLKTRKWRIEDIDDFIKNGNYKSPREYKSISLRPKHTFYHKDHGEIKSTQTDLVRHYDLNRSAVSRMVNGKRSNHKGWSLVQRDGDA